MKIAFFSNFLNHHQTALCGEFYKILGDDFKFIASEAIPEERLKLGYQNFGAEFPYYIYSQKDEASYKRCLQIAQEYDIVIFGSTRKEFVRSRMQENKLTFRYMERLFKKGTYRRFYPPTAKTLFDDYKQYSEKNMYFLCASAYTAYDLSLLGLDKTKMLKWGYFPEGAERSCKIAKPDSNNSPLIILWAGRLLDWKHPEYAVKAAVKLRNKGFQFMLKIIGVGEMYEQIDAIIRKYKLQDCVQMLGSMPPDEVQNQMAAADIYLLTSNSQEGWGAVINEAMSNGCAVVASNAAGAVPYLVNHNENGLIYSKNALSDLYNNAVRCMQDRQLRSELGLKAKATIKDLWNARIAAERFINISERILNNQKYDAYDQGPCSVAEIIRE